MLSMEEGSGEPGFRSLLSDGSALPKRLALGGSTLNDPRNVNVGLRRRRRGDLRALSCARLAS